MSKRTPATQLIHVSQDDIDHGTRGNCRFCPVARALSRHGYIGPSVGQKAIHHGPGNDDDGLRESGNTPVRVGRFINRFDVDGAKACQPFAFRFPLPGYVKTTETATGGTYSQCGELV